MLLNLDFVFLLFRLFVLISLVFFLWKFNLNFWFFSPKNSSSKSYSGFCLFVFLTWQCNWTVSLCVLIGIFFKSILSIAYHHHCDIFPFKIFAFSFPCVFMCDNTTIVMVERNEIWISSSFFLRHFLSAFPFIHPSIHPSIQWWNGFHWTIFDQGYVQCIGYNLNFVCFFASVIKPIFWWQNFSRERKNLYQNFLWKNL